MIRIIDRKKDHRRSVPKKVYCCKRVIVNISFISFMGK